MKGTFMKKIWVFLAVILFIGLVVWKINGYSNGNKLNADSNDNKSFEQILDEAKKSKKKIILNVYADWCSWCKKMARETYADPNVKKELGRYFLVYRLNGESNEEITYDGHKFTKAQLAHAFGVKGFPSTIFLNYNSQPITMIPGYIDPKTFTNILKYIGDDVYLKMNFDEFLKKQGN